MVTLTKQTDRGENPGEDRRSPGRGGQQLLAGGGVFGWDDGDEPIETGPCYSPAEAFWLGLDQARVVEPRDGWWRYRWLRELEKNRESDDAVARAVGTTGHRLRDYVRVVGDASDKSGTDLVWLKRSTIAVRMGCSVKTVERCRRAAVEAGYHSPGLQPRWIDVDKPGDNPWCASSAIIALSMPDRASLPVSDKSVEIRHRIERRRMARERAREDQAARDRAKAHEQIVTAPAKPPSRVKPDWLTEGVEVARQLLRDPPDSS